MLRTKQVEKKNDLGKFTRKIYVSYLILNVANTVFERLSISRFVCLTMFAHNDCLDGFTETTTAHDEGLSPLA